MVRKLGKLIRKPELAFVFIASFFGILSLFLLPILQVPDENQHFQVEYAMFSSDKEAARDVLAPRNITLTEGYILSTISQDKYVEYFTKKTSAQHDGFALNTNAVAFDGKARSSVTDIMRLPQAIGVLIGRAIYPSIGVMVLMGRLVALALYIVAFYFIIKKVRYGKWAFMFLATLPILIQQAASLSYDPTNIVVIFAWVAFIINLATRKHSLTRKHVYIGLLLAFLLIISKANNILLLGLVFALPKEYITSTSIFEELRSYRYWTLVKTVLLLCLGAVFIGATYIMAKKILAGQEFHPRQLAEVLLNTYFWGDLTLINAVFVGIVGQFSNFYYSLPAWLVSVTLFVFVVIIMAESLPRVSKRFAIISGSIFFGSILLISIAMYYGWAMLPKRLGPDATVTDGIQGRYFTPLLILLLPVAAYLQKYLRITARNRRIIPALAVSSSVFLLSLYTLQTWNFFWR